MWTRNIILAWLSLSIHCLSIDSCNGDVHAFFLPPRRHHNSEPSTSPSMMARSLVPLPASPSPNLAPSFVGKKNSMLIPAAQCNKPSSHRREVVYGLFAAGLASLLTAESANAAAKRAPPPPPEEKKDPSITGLRAKVLASIKRKEAMKEEIAKLREKGKPVN